MDGTELEGPPELPNVIFTAGSPRLPLQSCPREFIKRKTEDARSNDRAKKECLQAANTDTSTDLKEQPNYDNYFHLLLSLIHSIDYMLH